MVDKNSYQKKVTPVAEKLPYAKPRNLSVADNSDDSLDSSYLA